MIRKAIPAAPITDHLPGDEWVRVGNVMRQYRDGVLIATHNLTEVSEVTAPQFVGSGPVTSFFLEEFMPGVMATLTDVLIDEGSGVYRYRFGDGTEREYSSRAAALADVAYIDTDTGTPKDMLVLQSLRKDQNGANASVMVGQSCTCDCSGLFPVSVSAQVGPS